MKTTLNVELFNPHFEKWVQIINDKILTSDNKTDACIRISAMFELHSLPLKCGYGGSHIWVSDNSNERIAIYFIN